MNENLKNICSRRKVQRSNSNLGGILGSSFLYRSNILFDLDVFSLENKDILEYNEGKKDK